MAEKIHGTFCEDKREPKGDGSSGLRGEGWNQDIKVRPHCLGTFEVDRTGSSAFSASDEVFEVDRQLFKSIKKLRFYFCSDSP